MTSKVSMELESLFVRLPENSASEEKMKRLLVDGNREEFCELIKPPNLNLGELKFTDLFQSLSGNFLAAKEESKREALTVRTRSMIQEMAQINREWVK